MKLILQKLLNRTYYLPLTAVLLLLSSCEDRDNSLAPYEGSPGMSNITVEANTYTPKITWLGGYVSVVGINKGSNGALDSSLIWLIYKTGNSISYPLTYGQLPDGASDLTAQYGGANIPRLIEDQPYTYWVMKEDVWNQIKDQQNKILRVNPSLAFGYQVILDTIEISKSSYVQINKNIDSYLNIFDISYFGLPEVILGRIELVETDTSNSPIIRWTITQHDSNGVLITDSLISAIGIVEGTGYEASKIVWEVYSEEIVNGVPTYGKKNVIGSPVYAPSANIPETFTFKEFPLTGLERNKGYYLWIAAKGWNQRDRFRYTTQYAFITFKTN